MSSGKHCGADVICVEDEYPPFPPPLRDDLAFFDEASEVCELDLHPLVDDLSNRHQVLRDCLDVHDVYQSPFLPDIAQGDITDMLNGM